MYIYIYIYKYIYIYILLIWDIAVIPFFLTEQKNNVAWPEHGVPKCIRSLLSLVTLSPFHLNL